MESLLCCCGLTPTFLPQYSPPYSTSKLLLLGGLTVYECSFSYSSPVWLCCTEGKEIPSQRAPSLQIASLGNSRKPCWVCPVPCCHPLLPLYTSLQSANSRCNRFPLALHASCLPQIHLLYKQKIPRRQYQSGHLHPSTLEGKTLLNW